jgi:hypothetical protein
MFLYCVAASAGHTQATPTRRERGPTAPGMRIRYGETQGSIRQPLSIVLQGGPGGGPPVDVAAAEAQQIEHEMTELVRQVFLVKLLTSFRQG